MLPHGLGNLWKINLFGKVRQKIWLPNRLIWVYNLSSFWHLSRVWHLMCFRALRFVPLNNSALSLAPLKLLNGADQSRSSRVFRKSHFTSFIQTWNWSIVIFSVSRLAVVSHRHEQMHSHLWFWAAHFLPPSLRLYYSSQRKLDVFLKSTN